MKFFFALTISILHTLSIKSQTYNADQIIGDWISPKKDLIVRCYKENNLYYGKVVWFYRYYPVQPDNPNGLPESQWVNTVVMSKFSFADNEWSGGEIYEIKIGKTYDAYIKLLDTNTLIVTGYVFWRIFSETTSFTRYKEAKLPAFN